LQQVCIYENHVYICIMENKENKIEIIANSRFANYMTVKEWRLFAANYELFPSLPYQIELSTYFDMNKDKSFYEFIRYAFFWIESPEGFDYWFNISRRDLTPYKVTIGSQVSI